MRIAFHDGNLLNRLVMLLGQNGVSFHESFGNKLDGIDHD